MRWPPSPTACCRPRRPLGRSGTAPSAPSVPRRCGPSGRPRCCCVRRAAPTAPAELLSRLAGLPMSAPLPPPCGGLPTVLGADGVPMFIAHDPRNASRMPPLPTRWPADHRRAAGPACRPVPATPGHRRVLLAGGILASAAAVVAAGAIGSNLTSLPRPVEHQPASVQLPVSLTSASTGGGGEPAVRRLRPARRRRCRAPADPCPSLLPVQLGTGHQPAPGRPLAARRMLPEPAVGRPIRPRADSKPDAGAAARPHRHLDPPEAT